MIEKRRYRLYTRGVPLTRVQWVIVGFALPCAVAGLLGVFLTHGLLERVSLLVGAARSASVLS